MNPSMVIAILNIIALIASLVALRELDKASEAISFARSELSRALREIDNCSSSRFARNDD